MINPPAARAQPEAVSAYFDAAAGEPLHPAAAELLERATPLAYADPRRLHHAGRAARLMLDNARASVAEHLGARPDEVVFTPSGTHAVHLGVLGLTRAGDHIVSSAVEHASVAHAAQWHVGRGGTHEVLPVDTHGRVQLPDSLTAGVLAVQSANHEVGTRQPLERAATLGVPLFVDACASGARETLPPGWDAAAFSAHKWGGPPGLGVLLIRKGSRWRHPFPSDDRAEHRSTGFEDVAAALASAAALSAWSEERQALNLQHHAWIDEIRTSVSALPDIDVVGDPDDRLPHILTFSCLYLDGESLVSELDRRGYAVASGSACTASSLEPSHVLAAMGALTHGNVRVSLGRDATHEQVTGFLRVLPEVIARLRAEAGV